MITQSLNNIRLKITSPVVTRKEKNMKKKRKIFVSCYYKDHIIYEVSNVLFKTLNVYMISWLKQVFKMVVNGFFLLCVL